MVALRRYWPLILIAVAAAGGFLVGCSGEETPPTALESPTDDSETEVTGEIDAMGGTFTLIETDASGRPRLRLLGRNLTFDPDSGVCSLELAVQNVGSSVAFEPIRLLFTSFIPDDVEVLDPDGKTDDDLPFILFGEEGGALEPEETTAFRATEFSCSMGAFAFTGRLIPSREPPGGGVIAGHVFNDVNRDGRWSRGEPPLPEVLVLLYSITEDDTGGTDTSAVETLLSGGENWVVSEDSDGTEPDYMTRTDRYGRFRFQDLDAGMYRLVVACRDRWLPTTPHMIMIVLNETDDGVSSLAGLLFGCTSPDGMIGGMVYHDRNMNGERDEGEEGIPGLKLWISGPGITTVIAGSAVTDRQGRYLAGGFRAGLYSVALQLPPGVETTTPNPLAVVLTFNEAREWVSRFFRADFGVEAPDPVRGCMQFHPSSIDKSIGYYTRFSVFLCLPPGIEGIDRESIRLNDIVDPAGVFVGVCAAEDDSTDYEHGLSGDDDFAHQWRCCCDPEDGLYLTLQFDAARVLRILPGGNEVPVWVKGRYQNGETFWAGTWIRVLGGGTSGDS